MMRSGWVDSYIDNKSEKGELDKVVYSASTGMCFQIRCARWKLFGRLLLALMIVALRLYIVKQRNHKRLCTQQGVQQTLLGWRFAKRLMLFVRQHLG
jgi:hypothetical protein